MRTSTSRPTSETGPATCTSLFSRDRPVRWATPVGQVRERVARLGASPAGSSSSWSWCRGGDDGVHQHLRRPPEPRAVALQPDALLDAEQPVQPAALLGGRDVVGEAGRRRARALAVGGREHLVEADRPRAAGAWPRTRPRSRRRTPRSRRSRARSRARPRGSGRAARGSARSCTGGPSAGASSRSPTGPAGGAPRTRDGQSRQRLDQPVREVPRVRGHEPQARDRRRAVGRPQAVDRADQLREVRARLAVLVPAHGSRRVDVREPRLRARGRGRSC